MNMAAVNIRARVKREKEENFMNHLPMLARSAQGGGYLKG
jgi:hypothetical protein